MITIILVVVLALSGSGINVEVAVKEHQMIIPPTMEICPVATTSISYPSSR